MESGELVSARLLIEHAETQIAEVKSRAKTFFDTKPYAYRIKTDRLDPREGS